MSILRVALIALLIVTLPGLSLASGADALCTMDEDASSMSHDMATMDGHAATFAQNMADRMDSCPDTTVCVIGVAGLLSASPFNATLPPLAQGIFDPAPAHGLLRSRDGPWRPPRLI